MIEEKEREVGAYIHLVKEDLDRGPGLTYYSLPLLGGEFDEMWRQIEGRLVDDLNAREGEDLPLFQRIR